MCVRVASGGRVLLFAFFLNNIPPATGADLTVPTPPERNDAFKKLPPLIDIRTGASGFAEFSQSATSGDFDGADNTGSLWQLRGAVSREIGDGWNIQLDGLYRRANLDGVSADAVSGTAHGYFRRPEKYAVGAYLGTARAGSRTLSQLAALDFNQDMTAFSGGVEAAYFLSRTTLFAQAGAGKIFLDDADLDEASAKAGARYYLSDNLRLDLEGAIKHWRADDARANGFSVATTAHYRLSQVPVSAFGGYRFENLSGKDDGGADIGGKSHGLLVGFRYHFGSTSLKDEERTGTLWSSPQGGF